MSCQPLLCPGLLRRLSEPFCHHQINFLSLNLKGQRHYFILVLEMDKLNFDYAAEWSGAVSCCMPLPAGCFASSLKIRNQDTGADCTGKPLGRNRPSTWTGSTQGGRAKALKKLEKSEAFWPSWRREREGNSLCRHKKRKKKKRNQRSKHWKPSTNTTESAGCLHHGIGGWTRLYLFKTRSRFSCVRPHLVYREAFSLVLLIMWRRSFSCWTCMWEPSCSCCRQYIASYVSLITFRAAFPKHFSAC